MALRSLSCLLVRLGLCLLLACRGATDDVPHERVSATTADARIGGLELTVAALKVTLEDQSRRMHCFEVQRGAQAAWSAHDRAVSVLVSSRCEEVAGVCADTRLPPNTFGRYQISLSEAIGEADATTLRETVGALPTLPQSPLRTETTARIRRTRADAERVTRAYLAECDVGDDGARQMAVTSAAGGAALP